jgi:hypothetical protein
VKATSARTRVSPDGSDRVAQAPTLSDPCERRGQELLEYAGVVAVDGLDGGDDVVADEEGESHGGG